jgi:hypothetical protein
MPPTSLLNQEAWKVSPACTRIAKEDIRCNRDNVSERLRFLGRVIHGANPKAWMKEIWQRLGEKMDFAS